MIAAPATRFVGDDGLPEMLAPAGLTLADWKALVASGSAPIPTYPYPQNARWKRTEVQAFVTRYAPQPQAEMNETDD